MSRMNVVVVESPAKAKTINKYLGRDYKVIASYGHIRDLPAKDGSVLPDSDFAMSWEVDGKSEKHIKEIAQALRGADRLFLATDPDREGEAISWHVREVLKARRALKDVDVKRVVFNEVTRNAVLDAFRHPREIDGELVEAYLARRALDYLVGFTLSPLRQSLPPAPSASPRSSTARCTATRFRHSPPRPCSRKPRASSALARAGRCGSPSGFTRASISRAIRSASLPICAPMAWRS